MPKLSTLAGLLVVTFLFVLGLMWLLMPYPRKDVDYLVMGGTSTMVSMAVLFFLLIRGSKSKHEIFYKKKVRQAPEEDGKTGS
ncbi:MAG: hypothetical protein JNL98_18195 [Bryobacterales bacterium]|nr:hypothetical protein [Bryobacterales bacterium]